MLKTWLLSFIHLLFPRICVVCGEALQEGEEEICVRCLLDLPRTNLHRTKDNLVEQMFFGKFPIERATSFFYYRKGSDYRNIVHRIKYGGRKRLGELMGRIMATELTAESDFFHGMDVIVPVPLHVKKQRQRGFNQSECIARGISAVTVIPVDTTSVVRMKHTESQSGKSVYERMENVSGIFRLSNPERFTGKHILIVDDVLTTGATVTACADAFSTVEGIRISVLTLTKAGS